MTDLTNIPCVYKECGKPHYKTYVEIHPNPKGEGGTFMSSSLCMEHYNKLLKILRGDYP